MSQDTLQLSSESHYHTLLEHYRRTKLLDLDEGVETIHLNTLIIDHFPSPEVCAQIGDLTNQNNGVEVVPQVHTLVVTEQAVIQLLLSGHDLLDELSRSLEDFINLASPDRLEISGIDQLYDSRSKSKWTPSSFEVLDKLVEMWLREGLEQLVFRGQHHRIHRWNFANSNKLVYELVWTHIDEPQLNYSALQASQTPQSPYLFISPLKPSDASERKISWVAEQAYPHVHVFLMRESKRQSRRKMIISCPELTPWEMQRVCHELIVSGQMMLGGKADGMIMDSTNKPKKNAPIKVVVNIGSDR